MGSRKISIITAPFHDAKPYAKRGQKETIVSGKWAVTLLLISVTRDMPFPYIVGVMAFGQSWIQELPKVHE
jgi:hypothetical protein